MSQEKPKRGRPRKQPVVETVSGDTLPVVDHVSSIVPEEAKASKPKAIVKKSVSEKVSSYKTFLAPKGGIMLRVSSDKINVFDKETGKVRQMRYCPGENSIWVDEQSENALLGHVVFRNKTLTVAPTQPNLLEFLKKHPANRDNGGVSFYMLEPEKTAEKSVDTDFLIHDAISLIKSRSVEQLLPVAMSLNINTNQNSISIKRDLVSYAKRHPSKFIDMFDNPLVNARSTVMQAMEFQIVRDRGGAVVWYDTGKMICAVPVGQDAVEVLTRFCMTDNGASTLTELERQLEAIA